MSTPQQALVSLADAPAQMRGLATTLLKVSETVKGHGDPTLSQVIDSHSAHLLALASSLEQLQPSDSNTNSDQVTTPAGYVLVPFDVAASAVRVCEMHTNLARNVVQLDVTPLVKDTKAALLAALNNSTPERRE